MLARSSGNPHTISEEEVLAVRFELEDGCLTNWAYAGDELSGVLCIDAKKGVYHNNGIISELLLIITNNQHAKVLLLSLPISRFCNLFR